MASREDMQKDIGKLVAKAWSDDGFKARLVSDTKAVLKECGIEMPEGIEVKVVENTDKVKHFIIPPRPDDDELSDEALQNVAGGAGGCTGGSCGTPPPDPPPDGGNCDPNWCAGGCAGPW